MTETRARPDELKPGWKMVKFGDVVRQCKEKVDRDNNQFERYVEGGHMDSEDIHIRRWGEFGEGYVGPAFHRIFRKGQILYGSRRTYLKKVAVAGFAGITANTTFVLETKDQGIFMQELLPFLMLTDRFTDHSIQESKGSTNPYINWPDIAKFEFLLPPIEEQQRIAEILWVADEAVEQWYVVLERQRRLLDTLLGELYPCSIADDYLEKTDSGHDVARLGDYAEVFSGGTPSRKNSAFWNGNIPWIKTAEVNYYDIRDTEERITKLGLEKSSARVVPPRTVLVAMYGQGPTRGRVGYTMIESAINQACAAIIPDRTRLRPRFIYYYLKKEYKEIRQLARGAAQPNINVGMVKDFRFPLFDVAKQEAIEQQIESVESRVLQVRHHIAHSTRTAREMAENMVSGSDV